MVFYNRKYEQRLFNKSMTSYFIEISTYRINKVTHKSQWISLFYKLLVWFMSDRLANALASLHSLSLYAIARNPKQLLRTLKNSSCLPLDIGDKPSRIVSMHRSPVTFSLVVVVLVHWKTHINRYNSYNT